MRQLNAAIRWSAALLILSGCGGDGDQAASGGSAAPADVADLSSPGVDLSGGAASAPGGTGGDGGTFQVRVDRFFRVTPDPAPAAPTPPPPGTVVNTITELNADRTFTGTTELPGSVTSSGPAAVRSITVNGGDLVISGTLQAAGQGLTLTASGAIHVTGTIRTSAPTGGSVTLRAASLVISGTIATDAAADGSGNGGSISLSSTAGSIHLKGGTLSTLGGGGPTAGGSGGAVTMESAAVLDLRGTIVTRGGDAVGSADNVRGGAAGSITIAGRNDVVVDSALRFRGGRAWTTGAGAVGGEGGVLAFNNSLPVRLLGMIDGRGGSAGASAPGAALRGGRGGRISVGSTTPVASLTLQQGTEAAHGGEGGAAGGKGGAFDLYASGEGMTLSGTFAADGGASSVASGTGGTFKAECDVAGGDNAVTGIVQVNGGSGGTGGDGGRIELYAWSESTGNGSIFLGGGSLIAAGGGDSTGSSAAGKGGRIRLGANEGNVSLGGTVSARGGDARGSGPGGLGGLFWTASDENANGLGSHITVESSGVIDVSGGDSVSGAGGDAQWSTTPDRFAPDTIPIAVLLDADSVWGGPNPGGTILNNGVIVARGGASNGHGGDVYFHGAGIAPVREPSRGNIQNHGHGTGAAGTITMD